MSLGFFLPICLITLLSASGWAWAQVGNTFRQEPEKPFLKPYSPAKNYQNLDASYKSIADNTNRHKNIVKTYNKVLDTRPPKIHRSFQGRQHKPEIQPPDNPKVDTAGISLNFQEYNRYHPATSGSFLDGYLLKSLHEKRMARKKAKDDSTSDESLLKKKKGSYKK